MKLDGYWGGKQSSFGIRYIFDFHENRLKIRLIDSSGKKDSIGFNKQVFKYELINESDSIFTLIIKPQQSNQNLSFDETISCRIYMTEKNDNGELSKISAVFNFPKHYRLIGLDSITLSKIDFVDKVEGITHKYDLFSGGKFTQTILDYSYSKTLYDYKTKTVVNNKWKTFERKLEQFINEELNILRFKHKLHGYRADSILHKGAEKHTVYTMNEWLTGNRNYWSHIQDSTSKYYSGSTLPDRIGKKYSYSNLCAENIIQYMLYYGDGEKLLQPKPNIDLTLKGIAKKFIEETIHKPENFKYFISDIFTHVGTSVKLFELVRDDYYLDINGEIVSIYDDKQRMINFLICQVYACNAVTLMPE